MLDLLSAVVVVTAALGIGTHFTDRPTLVDKPTSHRRMGSPASARFQLPQRCCMARVTEGRRK